MLGGCFFSALHLCGMCTLQNTIWCIVAMSFVQNEKNIGITFVFKHVFIMKDQRLEKMQDSSMAVEASQKDNLITVVEVLLICTPLRVNFTF